MKPPSLAFDDKPYHKKAGQVIEELRSDLENGLAESEALRRLSEIGPNTLPSKKRLTVITLFFKQLKDFMVLVLIAVSLVSFLIQDIKDAVIILAVVVINILLGFLNEYQAEITIASLKQSASPTAKVIRDGRYKLIPSSQIVPGDILIIEEGDIIQADGRLCEVVNLAAQESFLTGESQPIEKSLHPLPDKRPNLGDLTNMVWRGSTVARGHGKVIVTSTGPQTELGRIAHLIQEITDKPTPLERRLKGLGKNLVMATIILCLLVATIGILRGVPTFMMIKTAIVLAIACIPEGLVAVVTIALALGVKRMARKKAIIRRLPAVETLGSVTTICSDKTGTLTEGNMMAQFVEINNSYIEVTGSANELKGSFLQNGSPIADYPNELKLLLTISALCNNAALQEKNKKWEIFGDPTEGALLILSAKANYFPEKLLEEYPFMKEAPFDTKRKCMSKIHRSSTGEISILTKGAPEQILKIVDRERISDEIQTLTEERKQEIRKKITFFAGKGFRILAIAYRDLAPTEVEQDAFQNEHHLIFLGFIALADPIRKEAQSSIQKCQEAGIKILMLTGDHQHTAYYIAKQLNMVKNEQAVANSSKLEALPLSNDEFDRELGSYRIFSRISPHFKLKIVESLKRRGEIVAMTGDGVNDAPAIKRANIGIAMGKTGTDVAKEAADIVLADDNFATIVSAIEEGRTIYDNILKFIRYLLSCNIGEIFVMLFATLFGFPLPFLPIQILWLNLVTDTPPALALGVDPPPQDIMKRPPRRPLEPIFTKQLVNDILFHGFIMSIITLGIFSLELYGFDSSLRKAQTMAFTTLVLVQLLHSFNCQNSRKSMFVAGPLTNPYLIFANFVSLFLLVLSIYTPTLSEAFELESLAARDWIYAAAASLLIIASAEIQKWFRGNS